LLCGRSALPFNRIPGLVNRRGEFSDNAFSVGLRYFFRPGLRDCLREEIHEQFRRFRATGLPLDHVNGHLHMHLHPIIFRLLMEDAEELGIKRLRLTFDPFFFNLRLASGHLAYRALHAIIFNCLRPRTRQFLAFRGIRHTETVFGLLQNARVDEAYILKLLPCLPTGDSELYSHPSLGEFKHELDALLSPRVRAQIERLGINLIRYSDL
jgi:chitin disaccharide deacetylase